MLGKPVTRRTGNFNLQQQIVAQNIRRVIPLALKIARKDLFVGSAV